jgi:hypothetical protein
MEKRTAGRSFPASPRSLTASAKSAAATSTGFPVGQSNSQGAAIVSGVLARERGGDGVATGQEPGNALGFGESLLAFGERAEPADAAGIVRHFPSLITTGARPPVNLYGDTADSYRPFADAAF